MNYIIGFEERRNHKLSIEKLISIIEEAVKIDGHEIYEKKSIARSAWLINTSATMRDIESCLIETLDENEDFFIAEVDRCMSRVEGESWANDD